MKCDRVKLPEGGFAIVCSRGRPRPRCRWCTSTPSAFQCDWKLGNGKTCDKHLCAQHATEVGPEKHLCPEHVKAYEECKAQRTAKEKAQP